MATKAQREHIAAVTAELYRYRSQIDYPPNDDRGAADTSSWGLTETQAMARLKAGGRLQFDCSEAFAWVLRCAGLWPLGYPGYTGTDLEVCKPHYTNTSTAMVGAGVVFGPGTGHHIAWVSEPGKDPLLATHGRPGFDLERLSVLAAEQARMGYPGVTFISIAHL